MDDFGYSQQFGDYLSYQDAVKEGEKRIIFTGPRRYEYYFNYNLG